MRDETKQRAIELLDGGAHDGGATLTQEQCAALRWEVGKLIDALQEIGGLVPHAHKSMMSDSEMSWNARQAVYEWERASGRMSGDQRPLPSTKKP